MTDSTIKAEVLEELQAKCWFDLIKLTNDDEASFFSLKDINASVSLAISKTRAECRKEHIHHFNPECDGCKEDVSCVLEEAEQRGFEKGRASLAKEIADDYVKTGSVTSDKHKSITEKLCFNPDHDKMSLKALDDFIDWHRKDAKKKAQLKLLDDLKSKAYCRTTGIHVCKKNPDNCTLVIDEEELAAKRREIEEE